MPIIKVIYKNPQNISTEAKVFSSSSKLQELFIESMASHDKDVSITYLDLGQRNQRPQFIYSTSTLFPGSTMTKEVFYLDIGTANQRLDKVEYSAPSLSPNSLRKIFDYTLVNGRYVRTGFHYEIYI